MRTRHGFVALASVCYLFGALALVQAFQQPVPQAVPKQFTTGSQPSPIRSSFQSSPRSPALGPLYFWGNKNKDDESTESETSKSNDGETKEEGDSGTRKSFFPFFANSQTTKEEPKVEEKKEEPPVVTAVAVEAPTRPRVVEKKEKLDPVEEAKSLRAQAERARLEADKMDAELTLRKITKLEKDIASAMAKEDTDKDVESLQREIDALQAKMRGETPKPVVIPKREEKSAAAAETVLSTILDASSSSPKLTVVGGGSTYERDEALNFQVFPDLSDTDFEGLVQTVEKAPGFMKKLFAQMTEIDFIGPDDINATEVATRLYQIQRADFSFSKRPKPTFTKQQIDEAIKEKTFEDGIMQALDEKLTATVKGNETAKALLALEYNYYVEEYDMSKMSKLIDGEDWLKGIVDAVNKTQVDSSIEILYPKCTRKEDAEIPTMAQIKMLMSDVLPKASFSPRGQPEQVAGGYIVRGTSKFDSGAETINAIDKQLEKSVLKEKMTVLYTKDFTLFAGSNEFEFPDPDEEPPILYVMGPDITPERKRIPLSIITSVGIATSWYLSVYPFLLNPTILKRTEEQLELADASMAYDLSWLTELSLPLFLTFIGIQMAHEAGHKLLGGVNGVATTFPTFVPSLITGVTGTVTQFKEPPKSKEAMFDVSIAGPLAGMIASIAALVVGAQLTLVSDQSLLPALPLDILRQSTLGGGIIDAILGAGALSVPPGAELSQAVAGMTVSLHPIAVAGYIGLIVNGLALLPIGTTDGGRVALSMFGREVKAAIGNIFLFAIFLFGVLGSDLFLFYFSFLIAFQTGNEIPARNEVDSISFSRVLLATGATVLAALTLIPFQQ